MKLTYIFSILFILSACSKPQAVLICGDHVCINKTEAEQYFEENLSLEVKIIDKKEKKELSLVELNLNKNTNAKKEIKIFSKKTTNKDLKTLSNKDIAKIKQSIKDKEGKKVRKKKITNQNKKKIVKKVNNKMNKNSDICKILKECNISEISEYLINQGKKKDFPDITQRQ